MLNPSSAAPEHELLLVTSCRSNPNRVQQIARELDQAGIRVTQTTATSPASAIPAGKTFDLVLVDAPDAAEAERQLKAVRSIQQVPILVLWNGSHADAIPSGAAPANYECLVAPELSPVLFFAIRQAVRAHRLDRQLKQKERELTETQRIARIGSWEWDLMTDELRWSDQLYHLLGPAPEATGAVPPPALGQYLEQVQLQHSNKNGAGLSGEYPLRSFVFEDRVLRDDRQVRILQTQAEVVIGPEGRPMRLVGICQDITERKLAEEQLAASEERFRRLNLLLEHNVNVRTAELKAANQELESFCYSVSHDLRAPLRAIDGFGKILLLSFANELPEGARNYLDMIRRNTTQMAHLIETLLSFARLGRQPLRKAKVNVSELVMQTLESFRSECPSPEMVEIRGTLPPCEADPDLLRQVWTNLLSNAFKYTRLRAQPRIEIGSERAGPEVIYFVRDNGVGFDMRYADKLFGVFQRLHTTDQYEGTGVGLATVQRIIHRHGGRIWAEAAPEQGATFFFTIGSPTPDFTTC